MQQSRFVSLAFASGAILLVACARGDEPNAGTTSAAAIDTSAGVAAIPMSDTNRLPASDADHEFLRVMSDHHEGLIQMATAAMTQAAQSSTRADAHQLHTKQAEEQKSMIAMVESQYGERITPMVLPSHRAMIDSLALKTGAAYDRTFYRVVVQHHREAIEMVDEMMPRFTRTEVKQMAERMKVDQQKESAEFARKGRT